MATILTGQYPFTHGVRSNAGYRLPDESATLAELLRERGYRTAAEISSTVLDASKGLAQGFDRYRDLRSDGVERIRAHSNAAGAPELSLEERPAADITRFGKRFLDERGDDSFFLWLHYFDPHQVYVRRPEIAALFPGDDGYLTEVRYTDGQVGRLLAHLEARGLRDRTLVILVADHGEGRGDHGESTHSYFVYESTIRVPLLLWGPSELPAGRRIGSLARTIDVLPTALDWLGVPAPSDLAGRSLLPLLKGPADSTPPTAYGESIEFARVFAGTPLRFLRRGNWKYIHQPEPELYDLARDPGEQQNLVSSQPDRVAALRKELETLLRTATAATDAATDVAPEERQRLAALGYVVPEEAGLSPAALDSLEVQGPTPTQLIQDVEIAVEAVGELRVGDAARAERVLASLVARHPRSPTLQRDHAQALLALDRRAEGRAALARVVELSGCGASARVELAELLRADGDREAQHAVLGEGVERCGETSPELLNNYAWVLATSPLAELRDGALAERLALRAIALYVGDAPEMLDTLAAAQAEQGNYAAANATLRKAIDQARSLQRPPALIRALQRSLATVRARQPIREE
jgi:arylsulfatase A-like enzyme